MHLVALVILGIIACFLITAYIKNQGKNARMGTEAFRKYYNKMRSEEKKYQDLMKELKRRDGKE